MQKKIANVQNSTCLDMAGLTCVLLKFAPVKSFSLELILDSWPKKDAIREDEFVNASSCEIFCNTEFAYFLWEKIFMRALLRESQNPTVIVVYMYTCFENYPYTYSFMFCYLESLLTYWHLALPRILRQVYFSVKNLPFVILANYPFKTCFIFLQTLLR